MTKRFTSSANKIENVRNILMCCIGLFWMRKQIRNVGVLVCLLLFFHSFVLVRFRSVVRALGVKKNDVYLLSRILRRDGKEKTLCSGIREIAKRQKAYSSEWSQHSLD